eukprot:10217227-Alexandrium_andersonii.AAC.1
MAALRAIHRSWGTKYSTPSADARHGGSHRQPGPAVRIQWPTVKPEVDIATKFSYANGHADCRGANA